MAEQSSPGANAKHFKAAKSHKSYSSELSAVIDQLPLAPESVWLWLAELEYLGAGIALVLALLFTYTIASITSELVTLTVEKFLSLSWC